MTRKKTQILSIEDFEKKLSELENLVGELDSEEISLQKSLDNFEQGVKLYKECQKGLNFAEKKIQVLTESLKLENYEKED